MRSPAVAPLVIDPTGKDIHGEAARIRERGPTAPIELPGGVQAWAVSDPELIRTLFTDPRVSKDSYQSAGDPIIICLGAAGRDPGVHGPDAERFDITRADKDHLAFGHGVHYCLGAPVARLEASVALPALFDRFPEMALAAGPGEPAPQESFISNGRRTLPVRLKN